METKYEVVFWKCWILVFITSTVYTLCHIFYSECTAASKKKMCYKLEQWWSKFCINYKLHCCRLIGREICGNILFSYCKVLLVVYMCILLKMQIEKNINFYCIVRTLTSVFSLCEISAAVALENHGTFKINASWLWCSWKIEGLCCFSKNHQIKHLSQLMNF